MKKEIWEYSVNRRGFFRDIGIGGVGLGMTLLSLQLGAARAQSGRGRSPGPISSLGVTPTPTYGNAEGMMLPFWADGGAWNDQEYFSTIQSGRRSTCKIRQSSDVDGDGQDELIGRCAGGILIHRYDPTIGQWLDFPDGPALSDAAGWDQPQYYETIQCADIDGDGQAEILGRASDAMYGWKFEAATKTWRQVAYLPDVSDKNNWNLPQYYSTLQFADIDGDKNLELIGRYSEGIVVWKYVGYGFTRMVDGPGWSDSGGWNQPQHYSTIQCADIDGDGIQELVGRNTQGVEAWKYDPTTYTWRQLATCPGFGDSDGFTDPSCYGTIQCGPVLGISQGTVAPQRHLFGRSPAGIEVYAYDGGLDRWLPYPSCPAWSDNAGWNQLEYSGTIQSADLYGIGQDLLIGRSANGIEVWGYQGAPTPWVQLASGPAWSDAAGWNAVEYYSTIHTARVIGPAGKIQPILVGRAALSMQTQLVDTTQNRLWRNSSAPFPAFTTGQTAAYQALTAALGSNTPIRDRYGDLSGVLNQWYSQLLAGTIQKPGGVAQADWDAVTQQIETELNWVILVQNRYANLQNTLMTDMFLGKDLSLQTIGDYFNIPDNDATKLNVSIASTVADSIKAIFSFFPWPISIIGAVAGAASTAITGAQRFFPNGGSAYQVAYAQLSEDLANSFDTTLTANLDNLALVVGGINSAGKTAGADYGLLAAQGTQIVDGTWAWPASTGYVVATSQRGYATGLWQTLANAKWEIFTEALPSGYPSQYSYADPFSDTTYWVGESNYDSPHYPNVSTLGALLDANPGGVTFPLGAPLADVLTGRNGWTIPKGYQSFRSRPPAPSLHPDIRGLIKGVARDPNTNEIVVTADFHNHGLTAATNILFTKASLRGRRLPGMTNASAIHYRPHMRIGSGQTREIPFRFPAATLVKGTLFNVTGRYKGGTFGFTLALKGL